MKDLKELLNKVFERQQETDKLIAEVKAIQVERIKKFGV